MENFCQEIRNYADQDHDKRLIISIEAFEKSCGAYRIGAEKEIRMIFDKEADPMYMEEN